MIDEIVLEEVLNILEAEHDPEADLQIISLSQADNQDYCECEGCKSLEDANGSHSGSLITFVNRIAAAVKEKGYRSAAFDTLAYTYTRKAPSLVKPVLGLREFGGTLEENRVAREELYNDLVAHDVIVNDINYFTKRTNRGKPASRSAGKRC